MSASGFFLDKVSQSPSMVRLIAFLLTLDATAVTAVICYLAIHRPEATVIAALGPPRGARHPDWLHRGR